MVRSRSQKAHRSFCKTENEVFFPPRFIYVTHANFSAYEFHQAPINCTITFHLNHDQESISESKHEPDLNLQIEQTLSAMCVDVILALKEVGYNVTAGFNIGL